MNPKYGLITEAYNMDVVGHLETEIDLVYIVGQTNEYVQYRYLQNPKMPIKIARNLFKFRALSLYEIPLKNGEQVPLHEAYNTMVNIFTSNVNFDASNWKDQMNFIFHEPDLEKMTPWDVEKFFMWYNILFDRAKETIAKTK